MFSVTSSSFNSQYIYNKRYRSENMFAIEVQTMQFQIHFQLKC